MPFDAMSTEELSGALGFVPMNHSHHLLHPIVARKLYDENGVELPGYKRLVQETDAKLLNVVPDSYKLIDNSTVFRQIEEAIEASALSSAGVKVATDYSPDGRKVFRQYVFPQHTVEVKEGVSVSLRVLFWNGVDGMTAFSGRSGAYTWLCANQASIGTTISSFRVRHAGEVDTKSAIDGLVQAADLHVRAIEHMRSWPRIRITDPQVLELVHSIDVAEAEKDRLVHGWLIARDDDGPQSGANLFTLSAVLSAWSTHGDTAWGAYATKDSKQGALSVAQRTKRELVVAKTLEGERWKTLEAA